MQLITILSLLAMTTSTFAGPVPSEGPEVQLWNGQASVNVTVGLPQDMSPNVDKRGESFSCKGSFLCGSGEFKDAGYCTTALRFVDPNRIYRTGGQRGDTGVCYGKCGIFVSGSNCDLSGKEIKDGYPQIRANGCKICGSKTYDDGCQLKIDYVRNC